MYIKSDIKPFENKVWLASPTMHGEEIKYVQEAYDTNWVSTVGKNIDEAEREISEYLGCKYAVGLTTGTSALHLSIKMAGVDAYGMPEVGHGSLENKHVLCSDVTFCASINPISYEGGIPVLIDSEYDTWNIDPKALDRAFDLYPDAKVVVLVHLYGTPANMDEIMAVINKHNAILVEDAAESLGATYKNKHSGTFGKYNVISFNGNKIITGSSGGMFLTDNEAAANRIRKWSTQARENAQWYQHEEIGYNYRISNIIAGVIRGQIPYLQDHIDRKTAIYNKYKEGFKDLPVTMNPYLPDSTPNFWLSCILINEDAMCEQTRTADTVSYKPEHNKSCPTEILEALASINVESRPLWKPMHMQPTCQKFNLVTASDKVVGSDLFNRGLCLPSDIKMTDEQIDTIIKVVRSCFN